MFDICSMLPIVLKGRKRGLDDKDVPKTPSTFDLLFADHTAVADMIDSSVASLQQLNGKSEWPLLARLCFSERRGLVVMALIIGVIHGFINSVGRFILLQAAINAVVNDAPMVER
jgi:hypothetical protein